MSDADTSAKPPRVANEFQRVLDQMNSRPVLGHCVVCDVEMREPGERCYPCEDEARTRRIARDLALSNLRQSVPTRYLWCRSFAVRELAARVQDGDALAEVRDAALTFERLVLIGPAGTGKTVLAVTAAHARAEEGIAGFFVDAYTLATARAHSGLGAEAPAIENAQRAALAVFDDVGSERQTAMSALAETIHARHAQSRPFIVTTWKEPEELRALYGDGTARRLFEGATIIRVRPRKVGR